MSIVKVIMTLNVQQRLKGISMNINIKVGIIGLYFITVSAMAEDCMSAKWKRTKPYDYYAEETRASTGTFNGGLLFLVENRHFTKDVRMLKKGSAGPQPTDLIFVLNTIPNHPSALDAYSRYEHRYNTVESFRNNPMNKSPLYDAECMFNRASIVFPKEINTYIVWGMHHARYGKYHLAIEKYKRALLIKEDSPESHYNLGLAYIKTGDIELAKDHAQLAYKLGYPLLGLKHKLAELEVEKGQ